MDFQEFRKREKAAPLDTVKARARQVLIEDMREGSWARLEETPEELRVRFTFHTGVGGLDEEIKKILSQEIEKEFPSPKFRFQLNKIPRADIFETRAIFLIQKPPSSPDPANWTQKELERQLAGVGAVLDKSYEKNGITYFRAKRYMSEKETNTRQIERIKNWARENNFLIKEGVFEWCPDTYYFDFYKSV